MKHVFAVLLTLVLATASALATAQTKGRPKKPPKKIDWAAFHMHTLEEPDGEFMPLAMAAIRDLVERNFQACNEEDLKKLMALHTSNCPDREEFAKECQKMFDETDVYIRLIDLKFLDAWMAGPHGPRVIVQVTQWTVPKDQDVDYSEYRQRSALLPPYELCEYQLRCQTENNEWKCHAIVSRVDEAQWPDEKPSGEASE